MNKKGHKVTVYEKNEALGGLLTLGIPDFKLEKSVVFRRIDRMRQEGVIFKTNAHVGVNIKVKELQDKYDYENFKKIFDVKTQRKQGYKKKNF